MVEKEEKWTFPFNIGYEGFKTIITSLHTTNADKKILTVAKVSETSSMSNKTVGPNLKFLENVGILSGDHKSGYKFTDKGIEYGKAVTMEDEDSISSLTLDFIKSSHLNDLAKFIETHKKDLKIGKIFKLISSLGKISMSAPYTAGIKTLLYMFQDANLLPEDFVIEQPKFSKKEAGGKKKSKKPDKETPQKQHSDENYFNFNLNSISLSISKDIDPNDLEFGKTQVEQIFDHVKKKIETHSE